MNTPKTAAATIKRHFAKYRRLVLEGVAATVVINVIALATSLFSMQVYDRVIPTHGLSTLWTLSIGVALMIAFEFMLKLARAHLMDSVIIGMDGVMAHHIFQRLLKVRVDALPRSVGSLSAQLKGYETIRGFITSSTLYFLIDTPFGLIYLLVIAWVGSPWLALSALFFFVVALGAGLLLKRRIEHRASEGMRFSNMRMGQLVETIEGLELIKAANGSGRFLKKWTQLSRMSIANDMQIKHASELAGYVTALLQSLGYAAIITIGAYLVVNGGMTMGALIACAIISGRMLNPIAVLPSLFTQMAHAKAALDGIEAIYKLPTDHDENITPLEPQSVHGAFAVHNVRYSYPNSALALDIERLEIGAGKKVAILGAIGSGKSTLLKLLAGLYSPQEGRVLLDGLDIAHISKRALSRSVSYMPQEIRLFHGTLKENLLLGLTDLSDERLREVALSTGLLQRVLGHPMGFDLPIYEGGSGLSGGQKQLVGLTRVLLTNATVWLLDEPTSSMDGSLEAQAFAALRNTVKPEDTVLIVTHKPGILNLVDEIVFMDNGRIVMYGPKDEVLSKLGAQRAAA